MIPINPEAIGDPNTTPVVYLGEEVGKALGIRQRDEPPIYRVGRKVGTTIYRQDGPEPSDTDPLVGVVWISPELAAAAVAGMNAAAQHPEGQDHDA